MLRGVQSTPETSIVLASRESRPRGGQSDPASMQLFTLAGSALSADVQPFEFAAGVNMPQQQHSGGVQQAECDGGLPEQGVCSNGSRLSLIRRIRGGGSPGMQKRTLHAQHPMHTGSH